MAAKIRWPLGQLIETVPVRDSRLTVSSYRTGRRSGRRLVVRNEHGIICFDTDECYDLGNAVNAVDLWLQSPEGALALQ